MQWYAEDLMTVNTANRSWPLSKLSIKCYANKRIACASVPTGRRLTSPGSRAGDRVAAKRSVEIEEDTRIG